MLDIIIYIGTFVNWTPEQTFFFVKRYWRESSKSIDSILNFDISLGGLEEVGFESPKLGKTCLHLSLIYMEIFLEASCLSQTFIWSICTILEATTPFSATSTSLRQSKFLPFKWENFLSISLECVILAFKGGNHIRTLSESTFLLHRSLTIPEYTAKFVFLQVLWAIMFEWLSCSAM